MQAQTHTYTDLDTVTKDTLQNGFPHTLQNGFPHYKMGFPQSMSSIIPHNISADPPLYPQCAQST